MNSERILARAQARSCSARHIDQFDRADVMSRLYSRQDVQSDFMIIEQPSRPTADTSFDVCSDGDTLFLSVLFWETAPETGKNWQGVPELTGNNSVEVIFCPHDDSIGFLQFGAGPATVKWFLPHWPYRDGRSNLAALEPQWEVTWHTEHMGEDVARFAFLSFPLKAIVPESHRGSIGFNVMRCQLGATMGLTENATWSHASGNGFSDATGIGRLHLTPQEPEDEAKPELLSSLPAVEGFQLQMTYDFADELGNGPYSPEVLREEFRTLKQHGFGRIYWLDHPWWVKYLSDSAGAGTSAMSWVKFANETYQAFGGDVVPVAVQMAHEEGMEFFTVIKPYDLHCSGATRPLGDSVRRDAPRVLSGYAAASEPLVAAHPEFSFRRNPQWLDRGPEEPISTLTLFADNDAPLPFAPENVELFSSDDNVTYTRSEGARAIGEIVERPRYEWSPAGKLRMDGAESVRCIRFEGLRLKARYFAVRFPEAEAPGAFGNRRFLLAELEAGGNPCATTLSFAPRSGDGGGADFRSTGFEFDRVGTGGGWSNSSEWIEIRSLLAPGSVLGIAAGQDEYLVGMLEPGFPEVRRYWLENHVQRAIDMGADGLDVRIAHHHNCGEWLSYAFAEPVLEEFQRRFGRMPDAKAEDYTAVRRIRGEFHTAFLREAKALLSAAGLKLEAHAEARMAVPPECDIYTQIHWDCATWIDEGIVDGVNLKYLAPFSPFVQHEIMPRARKRGIPVHVISHCGEPRGGPRAPELTADLYDATRIAGLNGVNLYEAWLYLRTTPRGESVVRGSSAGIFEALLDRVETWARK